VAKGEALLVNEEGKKILLKYNMNALINLEEAIGEPFAKFSQRFMAGDFSAKDIRAVFWSGLLEDNPDTTLQEAGKLMSEFELSEAIGGATKAFADAFGGGKADDPNPPEAPATKTMDGTGATF